MAFQRACAAAEVAADQPLAVELGDLAIAVARDGEEFFALQDVCSHAQIALSEGEVFVEDGTCALECWLHGSTFDLRTGKPTVLPATEPVATFPVEVRGEDVYVDPTRTLNGVTPS
ncbi:MAG: non-heme iron oxygenase ferredoxin subunit [Propionicimonas sp.]